MRLRLHEEASAVGQTVAFLVAGSFFLGILATLMAVTSDTASQDATPVSDAQNRLEAEHVADVLAGSPGIGWAAGPDGLGRLGLLHDDGTRLDGDRLDALRGALYDSDPANGKVDYEEALRSLGLPDDGTLGFHLRMIPVGLQDQLQVADLSHIRTAYIGDWTSLSGIDVELDIDAAMTADARAQLDAGMSARVGSERLVLAGLGLGFDDEVHLDGLDVEVDLSGPDVDLDTLVPASLMEGDVYPDDKSYLAAVLEARLADHDLLVIGSTVDHNSLTSNSVKGPISDWVEAGGTLVVLGSDEKNFQWLQPLFSVGTTTVNAAPAAPDVSHPMLHEPNPLDWTAYDHHGLAWDLKDSGSNANADDFQHIITAGGGDLLAISNEGVYGSGRVFLTTYRPGEVADLLSQQEAHNLVQNLVLYSDRSHLYLDYGPTPPEGAAVSAAVRTTQILDDDLGMVNVRLTVLYWGA